MRYVLHEVRNNVVPPLLDVLEREESGIYEQMSGTDILLSPLAPAGFSTRMVNGRMILSSGLHSLSLDEVHFRREALRSYLRQELQEERNPEILDLPVDEFAVNGIVRSGPRLPAFTPPIRPRNPSENVSFR